ncbi:glycosyltransferase family 4 protein [Dyadobacter sp. Leaf189]|uniref:glycosyltransferase family 4 protein n=1 Tax=Dyadobacter sp. Leaf189 TaxID=1736295 RepID=UPI0006F6B9AD|nr:glycosyltransferase family 4 protein [Dyadobacter sp. Leaf189]KQS27048.1 group 1 glycosyl transferase [Dyadobacter sp. Leaf189]
MKVVFSHPTGNANVRAILSGLHQRDGLHRFYTTLAMFPGGFWDKVGALGPFGELRRRNYDLLLKSKTRIWPLREAGRILSSKAGWGSLTRQENALFSVDSVYRSLDKKVASSLYRAQKEGVSAVYAYEDGALESFRRAKELGMTCVYDLPIAYWETTRKLIQEEAERLPAWAGTLGGAATDSEQKLERKTRELELADLVVTPSDFVAGSVPVSRSRQVIRSHFGSPTSGGELSNRRGNGVPLRVLFAGSMGQRKGLADLFEAVKLLNTNEIELVVLGSLQEKLSFYKQQLPSMTYEAPRPHAQVLQLMAGCDVLCLPSIIEGRALVMQEAMSQGMPVIITPNTGGEDLVIEGETGFLVPIRSPEAIAGRLQWLLDHREAVPDMGRRAQAHAATYSWNNYANSVIDQIEQQVNSYQLQM